MKTLFDQLALTLQKNAGNPFLDNKSPVYVYGAGNVGKDLARVLIDKGIPVTALLDRRAQSDAKWEGIPILTPDDPAISRLDREQNRVAIAIFNRDTEMPPIIQTLQSLGYANIVSFLDLHHQLAAELGDRFWLTSRNFYPKHQEQIEEAAAVWSDTASRELYEALLRFRFTGDFHALPAPDLTDQYFPVGLPPWPSPLRFIDCGAYDGDTLARLIQDKWSIESLAAFEPDPANYQNLVHLMREDATNPNASRALFPCGVGSTTTQVRFSSGQGSASCITENGDAMIQCVALDDALPGFRANLIKMDIEGAEYDALLGARKMIETHRPGLAISVYHRADHLWTIPLLAKSWLKGGHHYLRAHAYNAFELIYYWMP